jgi:hypothetical protein
MVIAESSIALGDPVSNIRTRGGMPPPASVIAEGKDDARRRLPTAPEISTWRRGAATPDGRRLLAAVPGRGER